MIKKRFFHIIVLIVSLFLLSCDNRKGNFRTQIGGEEVRIEIKDTGIRIFNEGRIIVELIVASNVYNVKSYADGFLSVSSQYEKWNVGSERVQRIVRRDGFEYLVNYNEAGRVKEELKIGPIFLDGTNRAQ